MIAPPSLAEIDQSKETGAQVTIAASDLSTGEPEVAEVADDRERIRGVQALDEIGEAAGSLGAIEEAQVDCR